MLIVMVWKCHLISSLNASLKNNFEKRENVCVMSLYVCTR